MKPFQVRYQPFLRFAFEQSQNSIPLRSLCNFFYFMSTIVVLRE